MKIDVIVLAAGIGTRTNLNFPKQLMRLSGKPILIHILELLKSTSKIDNIIVTVIPNEIEYFKKIIDSYNIKNIKIIQGGNTRQESCRLALQHVKTETVIVHEAARPFISKDIIENMIKSENDNIVPLLDIDFTLYDIKNCNYPSRNNIKNVQLPQKFNTNMLKEAHENLKYRNFTDDSSLFIDYYNSNKIIKYIKGIEENIKITSPLDIKIAEVIYENISYSNRRI